MLPKIPQKIHTTNLISTNTQIKFRAWQSREEKLLLMASDGNDKPEILSTVSQVVNNIIIDDKFDITKAPIFDVEWLFLQSRIKSVDTTAHRSYIDRDDNRTYSFEVDLTKVEVIRPEVPSNIVDFGEGIAVTLKWPNATAFVTDEILKADEDVVSSLLVPDMIDKIYDGDDVHDASTYSRKDLVEFVDTFPMTDHAKIVEYLEAMPRLNYVINYKNSNGKDRKIVLTNLNDFFSFR